MKENALDFDDLLLKTYKLLKSNPEVREKYQNIWKYIHIDEYQDTNKVQYMTGKLLADKNKYVLEKYLLFENIILFKAPIHIKAIINQLEFIKNKTNFGVYLMGGVSKITENDFNLIKK